MRASASERRLGALGQAGCGEWHPNRTGASRFRICAWLRLTPEEVRESHQVVQLGYPPIRIDLITSITGVPHFEEAWAERSPGHFGDLPVSFIGRRHLSVK